MATVVKRIEDVDVNNSLSTPMSMAWKQRSLAAVNRSRPKLISDSETVRLIQLARELSDSSGFWAL